MEKVPALYCARAGHIFDTGSTVLGLQRGKGAVQDECREVIPSSKKTQPQIHNDLHAIIVLLLCRIASNHAYQYYALL